jgi:hypothetical protein
MKRIWEPSRKKEIRGGPQNKTRTREEGKGGG